MKTIHIQSKYFWILTTALTALVVSSPGYALSPIGLTTYGGTGDQTGTGIAATSSGIYFTGQNGDQGVVGQYTPSLGPTPVWNRNWGGGSDEFNGVAATENGVYAAGRSYNFTSDTVGDKEGKGISVKFNTDGTASGGIAGAVWSRQTPTAPGGFPYGGHEWLTGITAAKEGSQNYLYTAGIGERTGFTSNFGTFLSKLDESGNVLWTKNDFTFSNASNQPAVASTGANVYMATRSDNAGEHPYLKSYDTNGNLLWAKTSPITGEYLGVTTANNQIFAVGQAPISFSNTDLLFESWDSVGNQLWSKTYDRNSAEDTLNGVFAYNDHLYAVGSTKGNDAGGKDGIILDIDMLTGNLLDFILWGGTADDLFTDVTMLDSKLYAVGTTKSYGGGGNDIAIVSFSLPSNNVPEPTTISLFVFAFISLRIFTSGNSRNSLARQKIHN